MMNLTVLTISGGRETYQNVFRIEQWENVLTIWTKTHSIAEPKIIELEFSKIRSFSYNFLTTRKK